MRKLAIAAFALVLTLGAGFMAASPAWAGSCYCTVCGDPGPDGKVQCFTYRIPCGDPCGQLT